MFFLGSGTCRFVRSKVKGNNSAVNYPFRAMLFHPSEGTPVFRAITVFLEGERWTAPF